MALEMVPQAFDLTELVVATAGRAGPIVVMRALGSSAITTTWTTSGTTATLAHGVIVLVKVRVRVGAVNHILVVDHDADGAAAVVLL